MIAIGAGRPSGLIVVADSTKLGVDSLRVPEDLADVGCVRKRVVLVIAVEQRLFFGGKLLAELEIGND